jgi:hypothetical protein
LGFATLGAFEGSYLLRSGVSDTSEQDVFHAVGLVLVRADFGHMTI